MRPTQHFGFALDESTYCARKGGRNVCMLFLRTVPSCLHTYYTEQLICLPSHLRHWSFYDADSLLRVGAAAGQKEAHFRLHTGTARRAAAAAPHVNAALADGVAAGRDHVVHIVGDADRAFEHVRRSFQLLPALQQLLPVVT